MDAAAKKKRYSAKKSPNGKSNRLTCHRIFHIRTSNICCAIHCADSGFLTKGDVNAFFNKSNTFQRIVWSRFPQLKCHNLTAAEWRKIRRLITARHADFHRTLWIGKIGLCFNVLQENDRINQLAQLNALEETSASLKSDFDLDNGHQFEIYGPSFKCRNFSLRNITLWLSCVR